MIRLDLRPYFTISTLHGDSRLIFCVVLPMTRPKTLECPTNPTTRRSNFPSRAAVMMVSTSWPGSLGGARSPSVCFGALTSFGGRLAT